ncbi:MAG: CcmD family protein [Gemmatimonadaceae bacterium]|nr:CcmD family protein [Gemmatimonadaceae bacterium]
MPDNRPYIIAAFAITWIAILAYGLFLRHVRAGAVRRFDRVRNTHGGHA